ncbi:benzoylformate decarboxylase [Hyphococcus luteus]|uniref:Benzoylformate decarboxylase n=1 Tax=Hyphococcus luteus TaxID=2058213 RepID=A0A2S7K378_9PROT|nr:benzoylformate decarboxylase [Marinicaulis flavus]PQA86941.1 benzoylformate decarboxylase [Marinicaulis flavus]
MTNVRDSVIDFLRQTGMTVMFGNPGSTELPLYRDWPEDFRYVLGLQESAVLSIADGYAQGTGKAAIVNLHSAAGLGHAMGSLVTAYKNQTPLIVTAGQQARSLLLAEPFLGAVDATEMPKPYVKWACEPARAEDVPKVLARAYAIAMTAPRGPVFVSLPVDDWEAPCELVSPLAIHGAPEPGPGAIKEAARKIAASKKPVMVAGPEIDRCGGWAAAVAFAEKLACPVWASPMSPRCSFPESHAQFAGFLRADETSVAEALSDHDLAIVIGGPAFTYHFEQPMAGGFDKDILQITNDPNTASYTQRGTAIIGDVAAAMEKLTEMSEARAAFPGTARPAAEPPSESELTSVLAVSILQEMRPANALIAEEAPSARGDVQNRLRIDKPESFFATASGGLGFAGSAAVGLALAKPDRRVIALLGDGSSLYTIQALWSAAQECAPVTYVILSNGGYEALKGIARRWQTPSVGTDLPDLDFIALAKGFGMPACRAQSAADLREALDKTFALPGPSLVDVVVSDG